MRGYSLKEERLIALVCAPTCAEVYLIADRLISLSMPVLFEALIILIITQS